MWTIAVCVLLLACALCTAFADELACAVPVDGERTGAIFDFHEAAGALLVGAEYGLFRYDGKRAIRVEGEPTGEVLNFYDVPGSVLLNTGHGLFRYDGNRTARIAGEATGYVESIHAAPGGWLVAAANGFFKYDGSRLVRLQGEETGDATSFYDTPAGLLLGAAKGLFIYDGDRLRHVAGDAAGRVKSIDAAAGELLINAENGLFRYDGARTIRVKLSPDASLDAVYGVPDGVLVSASGTLFRYEGRRLVRVGGEAAGYLINVYATPRGVLIGAEKGLFRYDGTRTVLIDGEAARTINGFLDTPDGLLLGTPEGLFRYDGMRLFRIEAEPMGEVKTLHDAPGGPLIGADNGLFRYAGQHAVRIASEPTGTVAAVHDAPGGPLLSTDNGLFRLVTEPLSTASVVLGNAAQLRGAPPNRLGVPTRWIMTHPCAAFATQFKLEVVAVNARGEDVASSSATAFQPHGDSISFEATVPVPDDGRWTFRVVSVAAGAKSAAGKPSEPISFATPGVLGWLAAWWRTLAASSAFLLIALNLLVFAAARYSAAAWALATDEAWGKTALLPQRLLLRHWQSAQLWLLDLYVRECRKASLGKPRPFLSLPLTGTDGKIAGSDTVLACLGSVRHLWIQGGTGMGKTATVLHLREIHFGGAERTAFAIFRRDGYVLVPIEARRFPELPFDEKGASGWVVACVLSVLSGGGLSFDDRGLLRAMLKRGTLAVAIDGLNEVARGQAVAAFAAEFPAAPLVVTSQELGEAPFEVWRLPGTIFEHVGGLLRLYLGEQQGNALAQHLRESGLMQQLRSGYDVRLVIDLAEADPQGAALPHNRLELYRAAVAAAWPEGDDRLELLQAAAWKLVSERGPNEDKRRLKPDADAPKDLLEQLEAARERSGRSIRLIRAAPPGYEFVHDQMNAYLAACWLAGRPTVALMKDLLEPAKAWQDGLEAQRTLWGFVAALLDRSQLEALWVFAGDDDRRAVLGRALAARAEQQGWPLTRPPVPVPAAAP